MTPEMYKPTQRYLQRKSSSKHEVRKEEVLAIRNRFPEKIPVLIKKYHKETQLPPMDKSKFLVPNDITLSQFQTLIRQRMQMPKTQALYFLVNEKSMLSQSLTLGQVYAEYCGPNGYLNITYASQEVFGYPMDASIPSESITYRTEKRNQPVENVNLDISTSIALR
ncbi:microtubule-associated proteins 1A/1B light chain 3C-like isoform X2 [Sitophilus oryzae]|uniref:Microtubule-associated proteins 1A/1B light chain 3C-like isoform X2 n=1 Tax=Sitophilus oryzae TaxID=7048 RepID=A0A6J2XDI9_SITOR|nr:microtubule-associated proteins 1A/1B light chain 3C-like isoform X2 [Sitophilus oryzae]